MTHRSDPPPSRMTKAELREEADKLNQIRLGLIQELVDARDLMNDAGVPHGKLVQRVTFLVAENDALKNQCATYRAELAKPRGWLAWLGLSL